MRRRRPIPGQPRLALPACVSHRGARRTLDDVAICGHTLPMTSVGIRALKDNLSRYVRKAEAGERVAITAHGRIAAVLGPALASTRATPRSRLDALITAGLATPPQEPGDPLKGWPAIRLPRGAAAALVDADRSE